jgi:hypothetical protein
MRIRHSRLAWGAGVIFAVAIMAVFTLPAKKAAKKATPHRLLTVSVDSNGVAHLGGVPLASTNIRDGVFRSMGAVGLKATFADTGIYTNETQMSNTLETLKSMTRAGLFSTNRPPNPYE